MSPETKVILFLVVAVVVVGAMIAGALDDDEEIATAAPSTTATLTESTCVAMRRRWADLLDVQFDEPAALALGEEYTAIGSRALCGDLVEDTDTPERETRCAYP